MKKTSTYYILLITLLAALSYPSIHSKAQSVVQIAQPFTDTLLCRGGNFILSINVPNDTFQHDNIFRVQISDSNGSFSNPKQIALKGAFETTTILCTLDTSILAATGYRIRVVADKPAYTSNDNGVDLRISDYPEVNLNSNSPVCENKTITLSASTTNVGTTTYSWTGPDGFSSNLQAPSISPATPSKDGTYTGQISVFGCSSEDTVRVVVQPPPSNIIINSSTDVCADSPISLDPSCNVCNVTGVTYLWTRPNNSTSKQSALNILKSSMSDAGTYKLVVSLGNCADSTNFTVTVKPLPDTPTITSNSPICVGDTLKLSGNSGTAGVSYRWEGPNGFSSTGQTTNRPNIVYADGGDYILYARRNGCDSKPAIKEIEVGAPLVKVPISGDTTLCPGDKLQLSGQTNNVTGIWEWTGPNGVLTTQINRTMAISSVDVTDAGVYSLTRELNGCKSPPSTVTVIIPDIKKPEPANNGPLCIGDKLELTATETVGATYNWTGPNGFSSTAQNPELTNIQVEGEGVYTVTTTLDYCTETDTTSIEVTQKPIITDIGSNSPVCTNTQLNLNSSVDIQNITYQWTGPQNFNSTEANPSTSFKDDMAGTYSLIVYNDGCPSEVITTDVESKEGPGKTKAKNNGPLTEGDRMELIAENEKEGVEFYWEGPNGYTSTEQNPIVDVATYINNGLYKVTATYNGCSLTSETYVNIKDILGIIVELYPNPNSGKFYVKGISQADGLIEIVVFNHLGRAVYRGETETEAFKFFKEIDLPSASSGVYVLQLKGSGITRKIRFTVVRQ